MLVAGLLPQDLRAAQDLYVFNCARILITYVQSNAILCDLGEELKEYNKDVFQPSDIGLLTSVFQYTIIKLILYKTDLKDYISKLIVNKYNFNRNITHCNIYSNLWSDLATPYLCYYENYNYNKVNIIKRNCGYVFTQSHIMDFYEPLYLNKEAKYRINLISHNVNFSSTNDLRYMLYEYLQDDAQSSAIVEKMATSNIIKIVLQFIEKVTLHEHNYSRFSFLSSNTAIRAKRVIIYEYINGKYELYQTGINVDTEIFLLMLYLTKYKWFYNLKAAKRWFSRFRVDIMKNENNIVVYANSQVLMHLYKGDREQLEIGNHSKIEKQILYLRYIEIGFEVDRCQYRFTIIAPQSIIQKSTIDKIYSTKALVKEILSLLKGRKYSQLGAAYYENHDSTLKHSCVFIYE